MEQEAFKIVRDALFGLAKWKNVKFKVNQFLRPPGCKNIESSKATTYQFVGRFGGARSVQHWNGCFSLACTVENRKV